MVSTAIPSFYLILNFPQIRGRCDLIVTWANKHRDQALQQLDEISGNRQKDLDTKEQKIQAEINTMIDFQTRVENALTSISHLEVLQVKKEIMLIDEKQKAFKAVLPDTSYSYRLDCDLTTKVENNIKEFIGSPVEVFSPSNTSKNNVGILQIVLR